MVVEDISDGDSGVCGGGNDIDECNDSYCNESYTWPTKVRYTGMCV